MNRQQFVALEPLDPLPPLMKEIDRLFSSREIYFDQLNKKYSDTLHEQIYLYDALPITEVMSECWHVVQFSQKLLQLFEHYNISPRKADSFALLAMALAEHHVPAFKVNTLESEKAREDLKGLIYFLEIRWIKRFKQYETVKQAIEHWLTIHGYNDIEGNYPSKRAAYDHTQREHRVLIDTRNSLNPKARGQSDGFKTPINAIPEQVLDDALFKAEPLLKLLEPIRQLLESPTNL